MNEKIKKIFPKKLKIIINNCFFKPINTIKYVFRKKTFFKYCKELNLNFYSDIQTVNKIIEEKKSLARFGDGELLWVMNVSYESYQDSSEKLANELIKVLDSKNPNLLIGLPNVFDKDNLYKYKISSRVHWVNFIVKYYNSFQQYIDKSIWYADTQITRCYINYKEKIYAKERYDNIKRIWNNKDVLIIEGNKTRMGIGNDLLSNAKSIERIICPAKNAFNSYEEIFEAIKKYGKNKLILMALGPTATILASDICNLNTNDNISYQSIDIGHLDIEYEWYKRGCKKRKAIDGKFVNEDRSVDLSDNYIDTSEYAKQIILEIK